MDNRLYLIDGMYIAFRAYYAMSQGNFMSKSNVPTGAILGFCHMITTLLERLNPTNIAVCFDCRAKTFRSDIYVDYKANRVDFPEDLGVQLPYIKDFLDLIGVNRVELSGYEADDIIGTYSSIASGVGMEVYCWSNDKDFYQLLDNNVSILRNSRDRGGSEFDVIRFSDVKGIFGVHSDEVVDYLSLIGDASDNVPGVRGIGEKTAVPLIERYKTIENIYANIDNIDNLRIKKLLQDGKDNAFLSKRLVTIDRNVPLEKDYTSLKRRAVDYIGLEELLSSLGLRQLRERWLRNKHTDNTNTNTESELTLW